MTGYRRRAAALGAAVALVTAAASGALAATGGAGHVVQITSSGGQVQVVFAASGLPANVSLDPASAQLQINGQTVPSTAHPVTTADTAVVSRSAMIVIDTSGSMQGPGITGAKAAALQFLNDVPADVQVGLISFSDKVHVLSSPTTDRGALRGAIGGLHAGGETALFDAMSTALHLLGRSGSRTLLVLTDGGDTVSHTSRGALLAAITTSHDTVDAVGFRTTESQGSVLARLAAAGSGRVITAANAADLAGAFRAAAHDIAAELVVTAKIPAAYSGKSVTVSVTASAGGVSLTDSAFTTLTAAVSAGAPVIAGPRPAHVAHGWWYTNGAAVAGATAIGLGVFILLVFALASVGRERSQTRVRRRLSLYTLTGRTGESVKETTALGGSAIARSAVEFAGRVAAKRDYEAVLQQRLEAGGVPLKPAEWLIIHVGATVVLPILLFVITGSPVGALIGAVAGGAGPWIYLKIKESLRTSKFLAQMPETLQLLAGSLSAGYSLPQAVDAAARESADPIATEFNRALVETRLGVPIEDALDGVADRMKSKDFSWVVMAIRIQREVGGNLAELLTTVAATLRERERLRRQVKVLSAEGRLSAAILGGLPVLFGTYLALVRPTYLRPLYTDRLGLAMLFMLAVTMSVGVVWLRKVVTVEV